MSDPNTSIGQCKSPTPIQQPYKSPNSQQDITIPSDAQICKESQKSQYTTRQARNSDLVYLNAIETSAGQLFREVGFDAVADDDPLPIPVLEAYLRAGNLWVACHHPQYQDHSASIDNNLASNGTRREHGDDEEVVVGFLAAFPICIPKQRETNTHQHATRSKHEILLHIAELSVSSAHQRRGLGKKFLNTLEQHIILANNNNKGNGDVDSSRRRIAGISLTTYAHLVFNGGFYRSQGFQEVPVDLITGSKRVLGDRAAELWEEEQSKIKVGREFRCWMVRWCSG